MGGAARGPGKGTFAWRRGSNRGPDTPRPAPSHPPGGLRLRPGRARTLTPAHPLWVPPAPHLPRSTVLPPRAAGAEPSASLFLLPRRAAGRRRFLPDASRRPAAPPAVRAGRPGKAGWAAGSAPGRRPLQAEGRRAGAAGWAAPAETRRGNQLRRRSLFRGPPRKPGPPAHKFRGHQ